MLGKYVKYVTNHILRLPEVPGRLRTEVKGGRWQVTARVILSYYSAVTVITGLLSCWWGFPLARREKYAAYATCMTMYVRWVDVTPGASRYVQSYLSPCYTHKAGRQFILTSCIFRLHSPADCQVWNSLND